MAEFYWQTSILRHGFLFWLLLANGWSLANAGDGQLYGQKEGYLASVKEERYLRIIEIVPVQEPVFNEKPLRDVIFDSEISREFRATYERDFGRTDAERNFNAPSRYDEYDYSISVRVTPEEDVARKRVYGEYMIKRLSEHHADLYLKSSPSMRAVYEFKDQISNLNVAVKKGYKLKFNYSFSGNYLNFGVENPYDINNKMTIQMDPAQFGPSSIQETTIYIHYPFSPTVSLAGDYRVTDGVISLIGDKRLSSTLSTSLVGSTYVKSDGVSERQHRIIVGFTWVN